MFRERHVPLVEQSEQGVKVRKRATRRKVSGFSLCTPTRRHPRVCVREREREGGWLQAVYFLIRPRCFNKTVETSGQKKQREWISFFFSAFFLRHTRAARFIHIRQRRQRRFLAF